MAKMKILYLLIWALTGLTNAPVRAFLPCKNALTLTASSSSYYIRSRTGRSECHEGFEPTTSTPTETSAPSQLRDASLKRWLQLPTSWADANKNKNKNKVNISQQQQSASSSSTSSSPKETYQKQIQTLHPDHPIKLGVTQKQRSSNFLNAAETGNVTRLELLLKAGVDVNAMDAYRISSLQYAACHGHVDVLRILLRWGATNNDNAADSLLLEGDDDDEDDEDDDGVNSSPLRAAFANGHIEIVNLLKNHHSPCVNGTTAILLGDGPFENTFCFNDTIPLSRSFSSILRTYRRQIQQTTVILPIDSNHLGAGSYYIDNAFSDTFMEKLLKLHESLRNILGRQQNDGGAKIMQSTNAARRSHYCDIEGWLCSTLADALQRKEVTSTQQQQQQPSLPSPLSSPSSQPHNNTVFPHVRFISYQGENTTSSFLAPHIDHPVLDRSSNLTSTHTFILYLTTVIEGGETVLLDRILPVNKKKTHHHHHHHDNGVIIVDDPLDDGIVQCAVRPVRGRLFVFPHGCPHAGRHVVEGSKLILRGDMFVC